MAAAAVAGAAAATRRATLRGMRKQQLTPRQRLVYENLRGAIDAVMRLPADDAQAIEAHLH